MTFLIETPSTRAPERDYILGVILSEFLGLAWHRVPSNRADTRITLQGYSGEIRMPDILFQTSDEEWLTSASLPVQPLAVWDTSELSMPITLVDKHLPVIYGKFKPETDDQQTQTYHIPIDIFGSAFFMMTRYEEIIKLDRDEHDRFPAWASLAYHEGFLERPIIDEYIEILWSLIKRLWPGIERKKWEFAIRVSHDVDRPSRYGFKGLWKLVRAIGDDIIKRKDFAGALLAPWIRMTTRKQLHPKDPDNTFDWIMDASERHGLTSAFYFMCGRTEPAKDGEYDPGHPAIRSLMRKIHRRGHEIGLHPSYGAYKRPDLIVNEAGYLKKICTEENIPQPVWGGRMHYLRWHPSVTIRGWEQAGMDYDSTLTFADHAGFRCGTCHEYPAFDVEHASILKLKLRPLIVMECTVMSPHYMNLSAHDAYQKIRLLLERCRIVDGNFTMLWHNTEFCCSEKQGIYNRLLTENCK